MFRYLLAVVAALVLGALVLPSAASAHCTTRHPQHCSPPPTSPPDTTITSLADNDSGSNFIDEDGSGSETVVVGFSSTNSPTSHQCQIDSAAWVACTSPWSISAPPGDHTVRVRGVNSAGADPTPAERSYTMCPQAGCSAPPPPPPPPPTNGVPVSKRVCVNTKMHFTNSGNPYQDVATTKARIDYLGVDCVRDFASQSIASQAARFNQLDVDVIAMCGGHGHERIWFGSEASCVQQIDDATPRLVAVTGMNEPGDTVSGSQCSDQSGGRVDQTAMAGHMTRIRDAATPRGLDTYSVSNCASSGGVNWWTSPLIPGIVNDAHSYSAPNVFPAYTQMENWKRNTLFSDSGRFAATEMGAFNPNSNPEPTTAAWQLVAALHHFKVGAERFAFYELQDWNVDGETFGFWSHTGYKYQAADALHRFMSHLGPLVVSGTVANVSDPAGTALSLTFTNGDGTVEYVALWNRSSTASRTVTLSLPEAREVTVYRPVTSDAGTLSPASATHAVTLTNDPVLVKVR